MSNNLLTELKEIERNLNEVDGDQIKGIAGMLFNRARNSLTALIAQGDAHVEGKLSASLRSLEEDTGTVVNPDATSPRAL